MKDANVVVPRYRQVARIILISRARLGMYQLKVEVRGPRRARSCLGIV